VHTEVAFPSIDPHALHVSFDFAFAVCANTPARAIADGFRTIHRTGHARVWEDALATALRVKEIPLSGLLDILNRCQTPYAL